MAIRTMEIPAPSRNVRDWIESTPSMTKVVEEAETFAKVTINNIREPAYVAADPENTARKLEAAAARLAYAAKRVRAIHAS